MVRTRQSSKVTGSQPPQPKVLLPPSGAMLAPRSPKSMMPPPPVPQARSGRAARQRQPPQRAEESLNSSTSSTTSSSSTTSNMSTSTVTNKGNTALDVQKRKAIWAFIINTLEAVQLANTGGKRSAVKAFQKEFYKETSLKLMNDYQKYFAQSLWRISLLPFRTRSSPPIDSTLKFLYKIFATAGTEEDKQEAGFAHETYPMFFYILKLINQSHMDSRPLVRLRVMEVAKQILQKHHSHPALLEHRSIRKDLLTSLGIRLRDKYAPVRVLSATILRYFADDIGMIKDLKYYARYDPNADVRRAAIASLNEVPSTRASFFYAHAFDPSDSVRVEALAGLASRSMINLTTEKREKVLYWGLTQEARVKKSVTEKLLPAWFAECNNNPLVLLKRLGVTNKSKVAFIVLHNIYGNNFSDTFDSIDRSFLDEEKLIPLDKMTLESVMFWMFLIKKFGNVRFNAERLLPTADRMGPYIKAIIEGIHLENRDAHNEGREEDVTLLMCLGYILSLTVMIGLEEGTRRVLEDLLREILLDPILDEAPLIKNSVDIMKKIVEPHLYAEKMMLIFQEVFEPTDPTVIEGTPPQRSRISQRMSHSENQEMEVDQTLTKVEELEREPSPPPPLTEQERCDLKDKVCDLAMQRLRLGEQKATAIKNSNFLEAHRLQEIIDGFLKEETDFRAQIITPHTSLAISDMSTKSSRSTRSLPLNMSVSDVGEHIGNSTRNGSVIVRRTPGSATSANRNKTGNDEDMSQIPASQGTTMTENQVVISEQNILKGLVMLTRFLSLHPKLTPFVRQLYENHIVYCLTDEDPRVRMYTLHLLCMVALIESDEKRKIMALMLRALEADADPMVKSAAFKGTVDLLLKYRIEEFKCKGDTDAFFDELPQPFNNTNATIGELEEMFVVSLDKFADERYGLKTPEAVADKVMGMIKLLQISRIVSESIVAEILCMWSDKQYSGSAVPFNIGMWLPTYTKLGLSNAKLVAKALVLSVKRILNAQDDPDNALSNSDFMKLVEFVTPNLSPGHVDMQDGEKVQEDLALMIFKDVLKNPKWTGNVSMVRMTGKLCMQTEQTAKEIAEVLMQILLKIASFPQTATVSSLKVALRAAMKRLGKQFQDLGELPDPRRRTSGSDDGDGDLGQPSAFSDSDNEERASFVSNVSAVPESDEDENVRDDKNEEPKKSASESGSVDEDEESN